MLLLAARTADAAVGEHHRAGLEPPVARVVIAGDGGGKADARRAASGGRDGERRDAQDEAQQLRLGGGGVAEHQYVEVAAEVGAVGEVLL